MLENAEIKTPKLETKNVEMPNLGCEEKSCIEMENAKENISSPSGSDTGSIDSLLLTDSDDDDENCAGKGKSLKSKIPDLFRDERWEQFFKDFDFKECARNSINRRKTPMRYEKPSDAPELALEYFRTVKNGGDYEYVASVSNIPTIEGGFGCHINFFARAKGTESSPEFFFASLKNGRPRKVVECCIINPKPFSYGETPLPSFVVSHCEHVVCEECDMWADVDCSDGTIPCI